MPRQFSSALQTYLAGNSVVAILLIKININGSTPVYYTDAPFDITHDSNTYTAQGNFLSTTEGQESAQLQISSVTIGISALELSNITTFANSSQINQQVEIRRGFINPVTNQLIGDSAGDAVFLVFKGKITGYSVNHNTTTADIAIQVSSQFMNFERKSGRRSNLLNFQREYPNDYGMEYSHETLLEIHWGKKN